MSSLYEEEDYLCLNGSMCWEGLDTLISSYECDAILPDLNDLYDYDMLESFHRVPTTLPQSVSVNDLNEVTLAYSSSIGGSIERSSCTVIKDIVKPGIKTEPDFPMRLPSLMVEFAVAEKAEEHLCKKELIPETCAVMAEDEVSTSEDIIVPPPVVEKEKCAELQVAKKCSVVKSPPRKKRKRCDVEENGIDFTAFSLPEDFKLPISKSPIMEAFAFCSVMKWGVEVFTAEKTVTDGVESAVVVFRVLNFNDYYRYSCAICSKHKPTEDTGARIKALRRWFSNFPKKKLRNKNPQYKLEVRPNVALKVYGMIERHRSFDCSSGKKKKRRLEE